MDSQNAKTRVSTKPGQLQIGALDQYTSDILDMVEERNKVFSKLRYHGYHRGELLGYPPTGRHVWWHGTPLFIFEGTKVRDLWVLGDVQRF